VISVSLAFVPGIRKDMVLDPGTSVRECVRLAGLSIPTDSAIMINGYGASASERLNSGDIVTISAKVKGNMDYITVTVARVPGERKTVTLNGGRTVADAVAQAGFNVGDKDELRVDNRIVSQGYTMASGQTLTITAQVKGN